MPYLTAKLTEFGPLVNVLIGVTEARRQLLVKHNLAVPERVSALALIDTGASISLIFSRYFPQTGAAPHRRKLTTLTASSGQKPHSCNEYDVSITLRHPEAGIELLFPYVAVAEMVFHSLEPYRVVIGRDLLADCLLVYDGQNGTFTFAF